MAHKITKMSVWSVEVDDRVGATEEKLSSLAETGADLHFLLARRQPDKPGKGVLFVGPLRGKKLEEAARSAGFMPADELTGVVVQGANKPGLANRFTLAIAQAGINLRGLTAAVMGKQFSIFFAFDTSSDADRGMKELRKVK